MLRSRMFTPMFRLYAGWAILALVFAALFGFATNSASPFEFNGEFPFVHNNDLVNAVSGPLSLGWKGPVGSHIVYVVWVSVAAVAAFLACLLVAFRDADPEAEAQAVQTETVPLTRAPSGANYWPLIGALSVGLIGIGWVAKHEVLIAGIGLLVVSAVVWTFLAWADRATGDDEVNSEIYHRFVDPLRIPVLAIAGIGLVVFGVSRVLLTVNKTQSVIVFAAAFVVFGLVFCLVAFAPNTSKALLTVIFVLLGAALLVGGVVAAVRGEREFTKVESTSQGGAGGRIVHLGPAQASGSSIVVVTDR